MVKFGEGHGTCEIVIWKDLRNRLQEVLSDEPTNKKGAEDSLLLRPAVALADDE